MTALFSTEPVLILGTRWRYAIAARTGRGSFQWLCGGKWLDKALYSAPVHGLASFHELHAAVFEPNREAITKARKAINARPAYQLTPPPSAMQFSLI